MTGRGSNCWTLVTLSIAGALYMTGPFTVPAQAASPAVRTHRGHDHGHKGEPRAVQGTVTIDGVVVVRASGATGCPVYVRDAVVGDLQALRAAVDAVAGLNAGQKALIQSKLDVLAGEVRRVSADGAGAGGAAGSVTLSALVEGSGVRISLRALTTGGSDAVSRPVDSFVLTLQATRC